MFRHLVAALAILLSGCATQVTTFDVSGLERSDPVQVIDLRPQTEKQREIFSLIVSNDAFAIYRVADDAIAPSAIRLLQHRAHETFGESAPPLQIKVHHLVVYQNMQARLRRSAIGAAIGGPIAAVIAGQTTTEPTGIATSPVDAKTFEEMGSMEFKRALYTEQENPGRGNVTVVYVETEIQGKRVFTRSVAPLTGNEPGNPFVAAVEGSIKYHLVQYQK